MESGWLPDQSQMGEQKRVLRMIPGLEQAEFVRFGVMHRNTFLEAPELLRPTLQFRERERLLAAGQITGTEGMPLLWLVAGLRAPMQLAWPWDVPRLICLPPA